MSQTRIEQMEQEIQRLKDKAKILEDWQTRIRTLDSFTPEEKIEIFDRLYKQAKMHLDESMECEYFDEDETNALYEELMSQLFGPKVWDIVNTVLS